MSRKFALLAIVTAGLSAGAAAASGKIEKPPGVPPEVEQARVSCPPIDGPCYGYYPTHWRVLPHCDQAPLLMPGPVRPGQLPPPGRIPPSKDTGAKPPVGTRLSPPTAPEKTRTRSTESPFGPVQNRPIESTSIRRIKNEVLDEPVPTGKASAHD